mmetsp:Transcript_27154/g.24030  ORF Transcript_27154/g.24030 Transcript_27154/m.24030 type:complete len:149 (+) Transcript_27154:16-462(+)
MKYTGMMTAEDCTESDYDFLYKFIVIGEQKVGKTNIVTRFLNDKFENTTATYAVEFAFKDYQRETGEKIRLQLWDTSGNEKHKMITFAHMRRTVGAFLVYDVSDQDSYFNLNYWLDNLREYADEHVVIMLIPNKCDVVLKDPAQREIK